MSRRISAVDQSDPRWIALLQRESDAAFVYGVKTTGIYCRSGCPSRLPRPENVVFFASAQEAETACFRACKRCRPREVPTSIQQELLVGGLCRWISEWLERGEGAPSLAELAARAGLSRFHTQRVFKAVTGLTPQQYAAACRGERVRREMAAAPSVTEAIYRAGYSSTGRFYERADDVLGMTPTQYRSGGSHMQIRYATGRCSLGEVLVATTDRGVCAVLLADRAQELMSDLVARFPKADISAADRGDAMIVQQVIAFIEEPWQSSQLPLDVRGTVFQHRVWSALRKLPVGTTVTYTELAEQIGLPRGSRAVASACAANPVAVVIPCHRVIRSDGSLSGYRWGLERKRLLLECERAGVKASKASKGEPARTTPRKKR